MSSVWGIRLGSGGSLVNFCEKRQIVGVGWKHLDPEIVLNGDADDLWQHAKRIRPEMRTRAAVGSLYRFVHECADGDYVLYYVPGTARVKICRVSSSCLHRTDVLADPKDETDVWYYRTVERACPPQSIWNLDGRLKASVGAPGGAFWQIHGGYDVVGAIVRGEEPSRVGAPDSEFRAAYASLERLVLCRMLALNDTDWEKLVADYVSAQGARLRGKVGGNQAVIDVEGVFDHGELGEEVWQFQVKCFQGREVDAPEIRKYFRLVDETAQFCFVAPFGFTKEARECADETGIRLLEAKDFVLFVLGGRFRDSLHAKLHVS